MNIEKTLGLITQASQYGSELVGRMPFSIVKGIVTANNDPDELRRIKATTAIMPGIDTPWLQRLMIPGVDFPVVEIGSTVLILYEESNPLVGFYIPMNNEVNAPMNKANPLLDLNADIPGIIDIQASDGACRIKIENDTVTIDGNVTINGDLIINGNLEINGATSASINGKQIATMGAKDNRNDIIIEKGW